jgi:hypothetical protein
MHNPVGRSEVKPDIEVSGFIFIPGYDESSVPGVVDVAVESVYFELVGCEAFNDDAVDGGCKPGGVDVGAECGKFRIALLTISSVVQGSGSGYPEMSVFWTK